MTANYVLLEKITVGAAGASSIDFSSIPQTGYTDLKLVLSGRTTYAGVQDYLYLRFNASSSNGSDRFLYGNGTAAGSVTDAGVINSPFVNGDTATASVFGNLELYVPNYASSNYKSVSADCAMENNATASGLNFTAALWSNTAAINQITLLSSSSSNFKQYSTFYLYGVAKYGTTPAIQPYATGGDTIMTDGTYWYHTFVSSGTFTPQKALTAHYLVVAGGGGGGSRGGGGGGAGGLRCTVTATGGGGSLESALSLASGTGYTVTIGAGGAAGSRSVDPVVGSNSVFSSVTSTGGGRGQSASGTGNGGNGGSGGGASNNGTGGTATSGQGFAGGNSNATSFDAGGGGGAGAVGANASSVSLGSGAGNGGAGVATSISGSSVTYGGGGGGGSFNSVNQGTGGTGGGGNGSDTAPTAGTANTGGGGGGAGNSANTNTTPTGAAGGSGLVIVRYAV